MEESVKERLTFYLKNKDIKQSLFCETIGVSQGFISGMRVSIQPDKLKSIAINYPDLNIGWLLTGEGDMEKAEDVYKLETKPRFPYNAAAGTLTESVEGVTAEECEQVPIIPAFPDYDFTIPIKGDSLEPYFHSGDEVACRFINESRFLQWGRVHVLDTTQGIVIKALYEAAESIRCHSFNTEKYPDFFIPKEEIRSYALIVGLLRL